MMPWLINCAWMCTCYPEARAFRHAMDHVQETQAEILATILRDNRETAFGRRYGFASLGSPRAYQKQVPLSTYGDYAGAIGRIGDGCANVLTREPVELLEPTSGTTGGEKLVPFTAGLRGQFQRAVAVWMQDLLARRPALRRGRAYWSISPAVGQVRKTPGGIPIGFDEDAAYLGRAARWALRRLMAVPGEVARIHDMDEFRRQTLRHLLAAEDLTLISIWSPTFLPALFGPLEGGADRVCGGWTGPRARVVRSILTSSQSLPEKLACLWPRLALISCWTDAGAGRYVPALRTLFPHVEMQPKGLLATEGCVSFPLLDQPAPVLAVRSHFFEFQETAAPERIRLAHELDPGGRYRVVLTTAGGLYRYQLGDEIEVVGRLQECPLLRFMGRVDGTSDLVGEKLAEPQVRDVLEGIFRDYGLAPSFALLVPAADPPGYQLYLQAPGLGGAKCCTLERALEAGLSANPHYAYARRLGQLRAVRVVPLAHEGLPGWTIYEQHCLRLGQRAGNIKPAALDRRLGWPERFASCAGTRSATTPAAVQSP